MEQTKNTNGDLPKIVIAMKIWYTNCWYFLFWKIVVRFEFSLGQQNLQNMKNHKCNLTQNHARCKKIKVCWAEHVWGLFNILYNLLLWASYIGYKSRTLGKIYGIKWGAIRNMLGEHIGNPFGTWWEHNKFLWEQKQFNNATLPYPEREKKLGPFGCMLLHFISCKNCFCVDVFFWGSWIMSVNSFLPPRPICNEPFWLAHHKNYTKL
jgi:hypothetical protein